MNRIERTRRPESGRLHGLIVVVVLVLGLAESTAHAGGAWLYEMGSPDLATASAGRAAAAQDASTAFGNPAGMSVLDASEVLVGVQPTFYRAEFEQSEGTTVDGSNGGNAGSPIITLGLYYVWRANERLSVGLMLGSYLGARLDWKDDWVGRYYAYEMDFLTLAFNPTIAYRVTDWLSVAAGVNVVVGRYTQSAAINNETDGLDDGLLLIDDEAVSAGGNVGVLFEATDHIRFGVTYRSPVRLNFEDIARASGVGPSLQDWAESVGLTDSKIDLHMLIPQQVMLSGYLQVIDELALLFNAGWQDWSAFGVPSLVVRSQNLPNYEIDRRLDDTFQLALGVQSRVAEAWLLAVGFAYDTSAVSDEERTVDFPVDRQLRFGGGVRWDAGERVTLGLAYEYAQLGNAETDQNRGPLAGRVVGQYSAHDFHAVNATVSWRFWELEEIR